MEFDLAIVVLKAGMGSPVPKGDVETLLNTPGIGSVSRAYKRPPPGVEQHRVNRTPLRTEV